MNYYIVEILSYDYYQRILIATLGFEGFCVCVFLMTQNVLFLDDYSKCARKVFATVLLRQLDPVGYL